MAKALVSPSGKAKTIAPVHPNEGIIAAYQRKLDALIDEMHRSLAYFIKAAYRANEPEAVAMDRSPAAELNSAVRKLARRWQSRFDEASGVLAKEFAKSTTQRTDASLKAALKRAGMTVEFKMTVAQNDAVQAVMAENVGLIKSIASQHLTQVQGHVMRAVSAGGDLGGLSKALQEQYGVTKRRAAFIARDQANKANAVIVRTRQRELGITTAKWLHSQGGKHPRPSHVAANNKTYDVTQGMKIDGEWIFPGALPNCRCVSRSIVPGFD